MSQLPENALTHYQAHNHARPGGEQGVARGRARTTETLAGEIVGVTVRELLGRPWMAPSRGVPEAARASLALAVRFIEFGGNVCFHGCGRKEPLLRAELSALSAAREVIFVSGNSMDTLPHTMFMHVLEAAERHARANGALIPRAAQSEIESLPKLLQDTLERVPDRRFLLVLFGVDGPNFARGKVLDTLAQLVALPNFRVALTVDTPNFASMLTRKTADALGLAYFALHTHVPYREELLYADASSDAAAEARPVETIQGILSALTANQQELVKFALRQLRDAPGGSIGERELFAAAVADAKVTSLQQFGENLAEALWHKLIVRKRNADFLNVYQTRLKPEVLDEVLGPVRDENESSDDDEESVFHGDSNGKG